VSPEGFLAVVPGASADAIRFSGTAIATHWLPAHHAAAIDTLPAPEMRMGKAANVDMESTRTM
jgi:hypothetical protein